MRTLDKNHMRSAQHRHDSGQILVIVTVALTVLLGCVSLGTDIGLLYYNWALLQKAADAAVLAGASYLPTYPSAAVSTADDYATRNGIQTSEITSVQVSPDDTQIQMKLARTVKFFFAPVLGIKQGKVQVAATAGIRTVGSEWGGAPLGVDYRTDYTPYQTIVLKMGQVGPGNWEPLALGAPGADQYRNNIEYGYSGTVNIGDWVPTETGNLVGPTKQGFDYRISEANTTDPSGTATNHTLDDPRVIEVPMVDFSNINGKSQVPVKGFAVLWIVGINSGNGAITTEFLTQVATGGTPGSGVPQYGAYFPVLLQ